MNKLDLIILLGSALTVSIAIGYILLALKSSKALGEVQHSKFIELAKSEQRLNSLFEHSLAGMFKFNIHSFEVVDANRTFQNMLQWKSLSDYKILSRSFPTKDIDKIRNGIIQNGTITDYEIQCTSLRDDKFWGLLSVEGVAGEEFAYGVLIDISKRKLFEEENEEQAALLNETQDAIMVLDEYGNIVLWNSSAENIYGILRESVLGKSLKTILFNNGNAEEYDQVWTDVSEYKEWYGNLRQNKADRTVILTESHWKKISSKTTGRDIILIVNTDITETKKIEEMYLRSQKMETLALLTSSIAHDLQNILAPVSMSIGLLKDDLKDQKSIKILDAVEESANNGLELLKKILTIGKGIKGENKLIEMNNLLEVVINSFSSNMPTIFRIERNYLQNNFTVMGDHNQLQQVFLNVLVNARDAMPQGGTITISAHNMGKSDFIVQEFTLNPSLLYGVFSVSDNGAGIKESDMDKIFDPFFTTKAPDRGTGLGLSIVQNIIKQHKGFIEVDSTNKGTTFKIYLPLVSQSFG
jgi:PAS domain S-box-containing protein